MAGGVAQAARKRRSVRAGALPDAVVTVSYRGLAVCPFIVKKLFVVELYKINLSVSVSCYREVIHREIIYD